MKTDDTLVLRTTSTTDNLHICLFQIHWQVHTSQAHQILFFDNILSLYPYHQEWNLNHYVLYHMKPNRLSDYIKLLLIFDIH